MILNQHETIIILGDSPFLTEIQDKVQYILERFFSIGINRVINKFKTNLHICLDEKILPVAISHPEIPTVTLKYYGDMVAKEKKELINSFSFDLFLNKTEDVYKDGRLAWCGFTHDYAISYCIYKGWKNIILLGAADFMQGTHFSNTDTFSPKGKLITASKKFIEEVCAKKVSISTCNPNSLLRVPRVQIDELLK